MPEYLAPGVFVEEIRIRKKPIEEKRTSTTGFVGPTCKGPADSATVFVTSVAEFECVFGGCEDLDYADGETAVNYLAHAARNFFENGGRRLYVARVVARSPDRSGSPKADQIETDANSGGPRATADDNSAPLDDGQCGLAPPVADYAAGLERLAGIEDIAIVAAPGYSSLGEPVRAGIEDTLVAHVSRPRAYRFAVLDPPPARSVAQVLAVRSRIDCSHAGLYYPWVAAAGPLSRPDDASISREVVLPPSGFVCGIYARVDTEKGAFKAPANEVIKGALRLEKDVTDAEQDLLNPEGVNCLRFFADRGCRVWGARTASSDPEWKYVRVRRYLTYLQHSIDDGTQWAVFEPNGERLWSNVRTCVSEFLYNEWRSGALQGAKPEQAFFVHCGRATMTRNDLDNGRLICEIGAAPLRPAEFVIFRIGQKTAESAN